MARTPLPAKACLMFASLVGATVSPVFHSAYHE